MILKRLLAMAMGALGLGALAAGPAFGQAPGSSNIPAPDIFDDQITCTQLLPTPMGFNLPSTVPMTAGAMTSPLDDIIGMGTNRLATTGDDPIPATVAMGTEILAGLGYVIPPGNMNCGGGVPGTDGPMLGTMNIDIGMDGSFLDSTDTIAWGSIPKDVADGYSTLLGLYEAVYGNPGGTTGGTMRALEAAQKLLDETDASVTGLVEARTRARDAAQEAHNKALARFNAASGGPIYQAGVAEWMAKAAVTQGIEDYNEQVTKTNEARTALNDMLYRNYSITGTGTAADPLERTGGDSKYVPLTNTSLDGTVVVFDADGMGTVAALSVLETYTGGTTGTPVAGMAAVPAMGTEDAVASDSTASNFTTLGELIVPMSPWDHDEDDTTPEVLRNTFTATSADGTNDVETIRTRVMNVRIATAALKEARDENTNPRFQDIYDEAYRRAALEQEYYDALWAQVLADTTDTRTAIQRLRFLDNGSGGGIVGNGINEPGETTINPDYEANPVTIASRTAAYSTESGKRMAEETSLRGLVAAREEATANVVSQFTNARAFYQQLVDRRTALHAAAEGDAAEATQKALDAARMAQMTINELFPDDADNPTVGLVSELLKTGGDDGQALVDAISGTYDATQANKDEIDTLMAQLTDADGNPIDLTDLGDSEAVTQNTNDITSLDGRVTENEDDIAQIETDLYGTTSGQHGDLAACDGTGLLNVASCADARSRHNEADIEGINDKLTDKKDYIGNLAAEIGVDPVTGEGTGEDGMSRIDMNEAAIAAETKARMDADTALGERIDAEEMARMEADTMLGGRIDAEEMARMEADTALGERIDAEEMARMEADTMLGGRIDAEEMARADADMALGMRIDDEAMARADADVMLGGMIMAEEMARMEADTMLGGMISAEEMARMEADAALGGRISSNADAIAANMNSIGQNASAISDNRNMIGELSDDLDVVRAGVAASMALAGMPAINGRGISIGVGSYDGESAFAVGFQIQGEQASFKVGVTSSGGETGASAGVGFNF